MAISNYGIGGFDNADSSFQGLGNLVSTFVLNVILGCTDPTQFNYNPNATVDDGSCVPVIGGCTDPAAVNYNVNVNTDNGSCIYTGCTDNTAVNYNPLATVDDGSCTTATYGCTVTTTALIGDGSGFDYPIYWNSSSSYNSPCDDTNGPGCFGMQTGTNCCCEPVIVGCTDPLATNYDPSANYQAQPGSSMECIVTILGCTNPTANNYNSSANVDDGSCTYTVVFGCTDSTADNYDVSATQDDGTCEYLGCIDSTACNFDSMANVDDGTCYYPDGCTDPAYVEYDASYLCDDDSCSTLVALGCTNTTACNYDASANTDDGTCIYPDGCTDPLYVEYDAAAVCDDGSCVTLISSGCTDPTAANYDLSAINDDGSCAYPPTCTDTGGTTYTIGDFHPTLNAILFQFSYDQPGSPMQEGDCGRMYVFNGTGSNYTWGCMGQAVPSTGTINGNLYGVEVQVGGRGYQNTEDMIADGCGGAGTALHLVKNSLDSPDYHIPSLQEGFDIWNNVGPGNAYNLGDIITPYSANAVGGIWISEEMAPPNNLNFAIRVNWANGGVSGVGKNSTSVTTLGVLYDGNFGCTDSASGPNPDVNGNDSNGLPCVAPCASGYLMTSYDPAASFDDGSCTSTIIVSPVPGCTDSTAVNYDPNATLNTGCVYVNCTDPTAINYNPNATISDPNACQYLALGDTYQGGTVFYLDGNGGGAVVTDADVQSQTSYPFVEWGCVGTTINQVSGQASLYIGSGADMTNSILAQCNEPGIAARVASNYTGGGYNDWYLPSWHEWQYIRKELGPNGDTCNNCINLVSNPPDASGTQYINWGTSGGYWTSYQAWTSPLASGQKAYVAGDYDGGWENWSWVAQNQIVTPQFIFTTSKSFAIGRVRAVRMF